MLDLNIDLDAAFYEIEKKREDFMSDHEARMQEVRNSISNIMGYEIKKENNDSSRKEDNSSSDIDKKIEETGKELDQLLADLLNI